MKKSSVSIFVFQIELLWNPPSETLTENAHSISISPPIESWNEGSSSAGIQYSRCSDDPTTRDGNFLSEASDTTNFRHTTSEAGLLISGVPPGGNFLRILESHDGIEDGLVLQARWKSAHS